MRRGPAPHGGGVSSADRVPSPSAPGCPRSGPRGGSARISRDRGGGPGDRSDPHSSRLTWISPASRRDRPAPAHATGYGMSSKRCA
ncbi:hypothetical protein [Lysobacter gummosus]|uniref:hypothetical protein n=1 Tax=Lysobacter gummosus TaxID=262324 RepID=UPI0036323E0B